MIKMFLDLTCFKGMLWLQVKDGINPYQVPQRCMTNALQKGLEGELDWLQKQQIIVPLNVDETFELCGSFMLFPEPN